MTDPMLKPCPFCGIPPKSQRNRGGGLFIYCGGLGKEDYPVSADVEGDDDCEDDAVIAAWNTRVDPVKDEWVEALQATRRWLTVDEAKHKYACAINATSKRVGPCDCPIPAIDAALARAKKECP